MKNILIATALALASISAPALASDFTGPRVAVTAGYDNLTRTTDTTKVTYNGVVGLDVPFIKNTIVGVEADVGNVFDRRDIGASVRLGYVFNPTVMAAAHVGYSNYKDALSRSLDGIKYGATLEVATKGPVYFLADYTHTNYSQNVGKNSVALGLGLRF
jgi:hypothetical protein